MGKHNNYRQLSEKETLGKDYRIRFKQGTSGIVVIAPHGGGIEPGTSEIATAVAGTEHALYCFEGLKKRGNSDLHITGGKFDEPIGIGLAGFSQAIVTIHGCRETEEIVFLGGRHKSLKNKLTKAIREAGFEVDESSRFPGISELNICNRSMTGKGVQLEISLGLRRTMFQDISRLQRKKTTKIFADFVRAIRSALSDF